MDWASAAVGLGGVVLAGGSTFLAYKARKSPFQELLFERRLDAAGAILRGLSELHDDVVRVLPAGARPLETGELLRRAPSVDAFVETYREKRIFLNPQINGPISEYVKKLGSLAEAPEPRKSLDQAFTDAAIAAQKFAQIDIVGAATSALLDKRAEAAAETDSSSSAANITVEIDELFRDFHDESKGPPRPGTRVDTATDLASARVQAYAEQRNLFLTHVWRPSKTRRQDADISIRLVEHRRQVDPEGPRPLTDRLVEKVEYHLGDKWFEGGSVIKTNAAEGFRLDISAYGPTLCLARVQFKDGTSIVLRRWLDFSIART
jgi:hypothetical protein